MPGVEGLRPSCVAITIINMTTMTTVTGSNIITILHHGFCIGPLPRGLGF